MRIIAGKYRGKKLISPKDNSIRPTTDKAREALFSSIQNVIYDCKFLDLFAGTLAISIEAFSRGAKEITSVEKSSKSIDIMKKNILSLNSKDVEEKIFLKKSDVLQFLKETNNKFDVIFADPPYKYDKITDIVNLIGERKLLNNEGVFILETDKNVEFEICENLEIFKIKKYSISKFTYMKYKK